MESIWKKNIVTHIYIGITESLCYPPETKATLQINHIKKQRHCECLKKEYVLNVASSYKHTNDPGPCLPRGWCWFLQRMISELTSMLLHLLPFRPRLPPRSPSPQTARWMPRWRRRSQPSWIFIFLLHQLSPTRHGKSVPIFVMCSSPEPGDVAGGGETTSISRGGWRLNPLSESINLSVGVRNGWRGSEKYRLPVTGWVLGMDSWGQQHGDCC